MDILKHAAAVVAAGFLMVGAPVVAQAQSRTQLDSFIDSKGKVVGVRVHLDRVGAVIRSGEKDSGESTSRAADAVAARYSLLKTAEGDTPLFVFATQGERSALLGLAGRIREEQRATVEQAGLLVTNGRTSVPNLMTNEVIVQFAKGYGPATLAPLGIQTITANSFIADQYLMKGGAADDALALSRKLRSVTGVRWAYPNFISVDHPYETVPAEPFFGSQWHLKNTGASGGTATADARNTFAWDITLGAAGIPIQIYELGGFEVTHEDLAPNLWQNALEVAGAAGVDDDGNGVIDDFNGWNFTPCVGGPPPAGCGNNVLDDGFNDHATSVSGIAASPINGIGGVGSCPQCTFAPTFRTPAQGDFIKALPFSYAEATNMPIVNNSWGGGGLVPNTVAAITSAATNGRGGLGTLIFFAAGNNPVDPCAAANPYVSHPNVISISGSSNTDRKVNGYAFGNCIGLLAPTSFSPNDLPTPTGTLATTTADRMGVGGYNSTTGCFDGGIVEPANLNYTNCFGGTSSATPLVSGVAGLMLTMNNTMNVTQMKNALQDTADKIEDSVGAYSTASGFSTPGGAATHGFGRVNSREAVRLVTPVVSGGLGSTDIFIRDNRLDWGNTDQPSNTLYEPVRGFIPHWQSVDIKVDAPPHGVAPTTNATFEAFVDEQAQEGVINKIYVRVRNRGPVTATNTIVKLHWAYAGAGLPALPGAFWTNYPLDTPSPAWNSLGVQNVGNLAYSGASVANTGGDAAAVVTFDFLAPLVDLTDPQPHHYCLFAVIDSTENRPGPKTRPTVPADFIPDAITPTDNNVTHRNIYLAGDGVMDLSDSIYVWNPSLRDELVAVLNADIPRGWLVETYPIKLGERVTLKPGQGIQVKVRVVKPSSVATADIVISQETYVGKERVVGGMTYRFSKRTETKQ
ncbi:MAG TPA: S8 family serine peptidase [Thermoanaerobaculia bacterium]